MQLHGSFQALRQGDSSVSIYMQQAKSLFDELTAVNHPMSFEDFNLYVFYGEFKDLVTSLITKTKSLSYADLQSHLLTHEFLHKNSLQSINTTASLPPSSLLPQRPLFILLYLITDSHWAAVKRILRYLTGTSTHGLHITHSSSFALHGFTDIDWAGSVDDRKYTGGYLVFFGQTPISWKSGKQRTIARSSTEAQYKALANDTAEVMWLQYLLTDLHILAVSASIIWCDNLGATYLSANPVFHARTKHVKVDYHFV
jgi:hypothetical protein